MTSTVAGNLLLMILCTTCCKEESINCSITTEESDLTNQVAGLPFILDAFFSRVLCFMLDSFVSCSR